MVKLAVVGSNEFVVGFQLVGIRDVIEVTGNYFNELKNIKNKKEIGIVVVDEKILERISYRSAKSRPRVRPGCRSGELAPPRWL